MGNSVCNANRLPMWQEIVVWAVRVVVGGVFTFSGFVKAVDPWGTFYKISDYASAIGLSTLPRNLVLGGDFCLFTLEFLIGVFLLLGCFRRMAVYGACIVMAFMLPLSVWIAFSDPVSDCGCFGDALIISNWGTLGKNILLMAGCLFLMRRNRKVHWLITPALQWIEFIGAGLFIMAISLVGYNIQPLIDFRPFKIGNSLLGGDSDDSMSKNVIFVYEKDGQLKEFSINDVPDEDSGWKFIERKQSSSSAAIGELAIYNGDEEVTDSVLRSSNNKLILFMPEINEGSILWSWSINSLYTWSRQHGIDMIAVVNADKEGMDAWKDLSMAEYPIYTADDTAIKSVIRGNPSVLYLEDDKIVWKSTLSALDNDDFLSDATESDIHKFPIDTHNWLERMCLFFLILSVLLIFFSHVPMMIPKKKDKEC